MRIVRSNPDRDENKPASIDDCLGHRCQAHRDVPPIDDSEESSGAECGICIGQKFVLLYEEKAEEDILNKLYWPIVEIARARLNLLSLGSGEVFVDEARKHMDEYVQSRTQLEGDAHAKVSQSADTGSRAGTATQTDRPRES